MFHHQPHLQIISYPFFPTSVIRCPTPDSTSISMGSGELKILSDLLCLLFFSRSWSGSFTLLSNSLLKLRNNSEADSSLTKMWCPTEHRVGETVNQLRKLFKPPATQILVNVEKQSKYPFIIFGPLGSDFDPRGLMPTASTNVLSPELRINDGIYEICGSVTRPSPGPYGESSSLDVDPDGRLIQSSTHQSHVAGEVIPADHHTYYDPTATPLGYVVSAFQTFPGEDSERLEENWIVWTGMWWYDMRLIIRQFIYCPSREFLNFHMLRCFN